MQAGAGSGIRFMSDSLIAFQPAIDEPSNIWPSANVSSSIIETSNVTCCHLPRGSVKRKSTYFTSLSLIIFITFLAVVIALKSPCYGYTDPTNGPRLDGICSGFACPDPDRFFDIGHENFAVADAARLCSAPDRIDRFVGHVVAQHDFDFHFREKIDHVLGAAIEFGVTFLTTEAFGLGDSDALQPNFLQGITV